MALDSQLEAEWFGLKDSYSAFGIPLVQEAADAAGVMHRHIINTTTLIEYRTWIILLGKEQMLE